MGRRWSLRWWAEVFVRCAAIKPFGTCTSLIVVFVKSTRKRLSIAIFDISSAICMIVKPARSIGGSNATIPRPLLKIDTSVLLYGANMAAFATATLR